MPAKTHNQPDIRKSWKGENVGPDEVKLGKKTLENDGTNLSLNAEAFLVRYGNDATL